MQNNDEILPVEVKSGTTGRLKSLKMYLEEKNVSLGIRISKNELEFSNEILSVPFYMISQIKRLLREIK